MKSNYQKIFCSIVICVLTFFIIGNVNAQRLCNNNLPVTQAHLQNIVIQSSGIERSFLLYTPAGYYAGRHSKVVFMFHGTNQDGLKMYNNTRWMAEANQDKFLLILPNSLCYYLKDEQAVKSRWNDGNLKLRPNETGADDVQFFRDMQGWIENYRDSLNQGATNMPDSKIFISGFSNGASFCSRLLMEASRNIVAAAFVAGLLPTTSVAQPATVVPTIMVYGGKDERVLDTLKTMSVRFPASPTAFSNNMLFRAITNWHLQRNELVNVFTSTSDTSKYSLVYNQPKTGQGIKRKYVEIKVFRGLTHSYPKMAATMFNNFFKQF